MISVALAERCTVVLQRNCVVWGARCTCDETQHYDGYHPVTGYELEALGRFVADDGCDTDDDECKAYNDAVDNLAEFVLCLVHLVEPVQDC